MKTTPDSKQLFESRREAKWQFRRRLLLCCAGILKSDPAAWGKLVGELKQRQSHPDEIVRELADQWMGKAESPEALIAFIETNFAEDTPEGAKRHELQDATEGHPFAAILPPKTREAIYQKAYYPQRHEQSPA